MVAEKKHIGRRGHALPKPKSRAPGVVDIVSEVIEIIAEKNHVVVFLVRQPIVGVFDVLVDVRYDERLHGRMPRLLHRAARAAWPPCNPSNPLLLAKDGVWPQTLVLKPGRGRPPVLGGVQSSRSSLAKRGFVCDSFGMRREFNVFVERDSEGYYIATVPELRGCHTQARSLDKLLTRITEAIELCVEVEGVEAGATEFVGVQRVAVEV